MERIFDSADRRRVPAQITDEGRRRFEAAAQLERQVEQELYLSFSGEDREQFIGRWKRYEY